MRELFPNLRALAPDFVSGLPQSAPDGLQMFPLLMGLFGGLALFLFGTEQMAGALKAIAGERMKIILARLTANRFLGVLSGVFVTAVIQSSSVTTVLVVGFISAGMMTLSQSVGVILGATLGTTITAQVIAFKVTKIALLMIAVGFAMEFVSKKEAMKQRGRCVLGLGLIFFGMTVMGNAMAPLRDHSPFLDWMVRMENPYLGIFIGAVFTAVIQSSAATTGVVIVMASQGLVNLPAGIALVFGANIGTCVTALLASIGKPREAARAAVIHIIFKIVGVAIWVGFIDRLGELVTWISPVAEGLTGVDKLAAEAPRQIANAHTIFNLANTLLFLPFTGLFIRLVEWLVPDRPPKDGAVVRTKYLDPDLLDNPSLALDRVRLELLHMGDTIHEMLREILPNMISGTHESLERIRCMDDRVDILYGQIVTYMGKISQAALTQRQTKELLTLMEAANDLESIGDVVETNLVACGTRRIADGVQISEGTQEVIREFHAAVTRALENALLAVTQRNERAAQSVISMKKEINRMADNAALHYAQRLVAAEPNRMHTYALETEIIGDLKRIYYYSRRMARGTAPPNWLADDRP